MRTYHRTERVATLRHQDRCIEEVFTNTASQCALKCLHIFVSEVCRVRHIHESHLGVHGLWKQRRVFDRWTCYCVVFGWALNLNILSRVPLVYSAVLNASNAQGLVYQRPAQVSSQSKNLSSCFANKNSISARVILSVTVLSYPGPACQKRRDA